MKAWNRKQLDWQGDSGATLIELLAVMAILALVAVLAAPAIKLSRSESATVFAHQIIYDLAEARSAAISRQIESSLEINASTRTVVRSGTTVVHRPIPQGVAVGVVAAKAYVRGVQTAAISFFPDGSSTGGRVTVRDDNVTRVVNVDWLTGHIGVEDDP